MSLIFLPSKTLQVQQFKSGFDENKLRIRALENELLLTSKQLEEERSRQREMKRKVDEVEEAKGLKDQEYESKIKEVKGDVEELKSRLVEVTKYEIILFFLINYFYWCCKCSFPGLSDVGSISSRCLGNEPVQPRSQGLVLLVPPPRTDRGDEKERTLGANLEPVLLRWKDGG